ncbi:class A beta-lactamase [Salinisphaera hydrothermalis]|uniref:Beta-lactamase n=1 Tax=Salinisphaera hydrothermalis (strain C41B8) TaxID=1304275 RepID=A0A084IPD5_SALHC|nr:class A beta-lactamase [Salinisphaera hydrothermalis]KEZ78569.1 beta-lactamase [Salinisphaera hydrothermalis C41B8]
MSSHLAGTRRLTPYRLFAVCLTAMLCFSTQAATPTAGRLVAGIAHIESQYGGRLGVAVLDSATGRIASYRGDERFPMCSTFKIFAAAAMLANVDAGSERLNRRITYEPKDLVIYSPITRGHLTDGMTLGALARAAVRWSDNSAANLVLDSFGGPDALNTYLRGLGDRVTRLDSREPICSQIVAGSVANTSTPVAMVGTMRSILLGDALTASSRRRLTGWMIDGRTGDKRLRAGLPASWRVGDKTGSGDLATANDVAIAWPPHGPPLLIAVFFTGAPGAVDRDRPIADVGRLIGRLYTN